jgi:hypothetical protein
MIDKYKDETRVRNLALEYIESRESKTLTKLYEALRYLSKGLFLKYVKHKKQSDFDEDIIHDACAVCVENLQKGTVEADSGWSKYIIQVLRNRSKVTNPLHLAHSRWKRGKASQKLKDKIADSESKGKFPLHYNVQDSVEVYSDINNIKCLEVPEDIEEMDDILTSFLRSYVEEMSRNLPFKSPATLDLFLYYSASSLFEISTDNTVFHSRSGFPKRYRFIASYARNKFKQLVRNCVG